MFAVQMTLEADAKVKILGKEDTLTQVVKNSVQRINKLLLYQITPFFSESILAVEEALLCIVIVNLKPDELSSTSVTDFIGSLKDIRNSHSTNFYPKILLCWIGEAENPNTSKEYLQLENTWLKTQLIADSSLKLEMESELEESLYTSVLDILATIDDERKDYFNQELDKLRDAQKASITPKRFDERIDAIAKLLNEWDSRAEIIKKGMEAQDQRLEKLQRHIASLESPSGSKSIPTVGLRLYDPTHYFRDRDEERRQLRTLLSSRDTKIVSVIGFGGIGKSALVCKVLNEIELNEDVFSSMVKAGAKSELSGVVYMSSQTNKITLERIFLDLGDILDQIHGKDGFYKQNFLDTWNNSKLSLQDKLEILLRQFDQSKVIVLWDNFESYLDNKKQINDPDLESFFEAFLRSPSQLCLVITTRRPIEFPVDLQKFDKQIEVRNALPNVDAIQMLKDLDTNGKSGLSSQSDSVLELAVEKVKGVPRALEILNSILAKSPLLKLETLLSEDKIFSQEAIVERLVEANYGYLDNYSRKLLEVIAVFDRPVKSEAVDFMLQPFAKGINTPSIVQDLFEIALVNVEKPSEN